MDRVFRSKVAGVSLRQEEICLCEEGDPVYLMRDRENPHDENAIKVVCRGYHIGFVPRVEAVRLAAELDTGATVRAKLEQFTGGVAGAEYIGIILWIQVCR